MEGDGILVDGRPDFEVLIQGEHVLMLVRGEEATDRDMAASERPWLTHPLPVEDARILALNLQDAAGVVAASEED